jgi:hypothetical protein
MAGTRFIGAYEQRLSSHFFSCTADLDVCCNDEGKRCSRDYGTFAAELWSSAAKVAADARYSGDRRSRAANFYWQGTQDYPTSE